VKSFGPLLAKGLTRCHDLRVGGEVDVTVDKAKVWVSKQMVGPVDDEDAPCATHDHVAEECRDEP
jgi:hypothetical protein